MAYLDTTVVIAGAAFVAGWLFMPKVIAAVKALLAKIQGKLP